MEQQRYIFNPQVICRFKELLSLGGTNSENFEFLRNPVKEGELEPFSSTLYKALAYVNNLEDVYLLKALLELKPCRTKLEIAQRESLRYILGVKHGNILARMERTLAHSSYSSPYSSILYGGDTGEPHIYPVSGKTRSLNRDINERLGMSQCSSEHPNFKRERKFLFNKSQISNEIWNFVEPFTMEV
jgi:hypothetical protein|tara:strand:+ start:377 stop:937 length:561 start_codon:yes stop_codon:yes gene_type:complete